MPSGAGTLVTSVLTFILLVVDALRSDRLALYGETRVRTPNMTAAGKNAVVYLHNQAASPSSPPSHGSIQTGMIPRVHGVAGDGVVGTGRGSRPQRRPGGGDSGLTGAASQSAGTKSVGSIGSRE